MPRELQYVSQTTLEATLQAPDLTRPILHLIATLVLTTSYANAQSATLVEDVNRNWGPAGSQPAILGVAAHGVIFSAYIPTLGTSVWSTDGTPGGTHLLFEDCPGSGSGVLSPLGGTPGRQIFLASQACDSIPREIYGTDGTLDGTLQLAVAPSGSHFHTGASAQDLPSSARLPFFATDLDDVSTLWVTDGTPIGTQPLQVLPGTAQQLVPVGSSFYFVAREFDLDAWRLWRTDGTAAGTREVATLPHANEGPRLVASSGSLLYFVLEFERQEIWRSDGTPAGTWRLFEFPGARAEIQRVVTTLDRAYFVAWDSSTGQDVWTSDGTTTGTYPVTRFGNEWPVILPWDSPIGILGTSVYFLADDGVDGPMLWRAGPGPAELRALGPSCEAWQCSEGPVRAGNSLIFLGSDEASGIEYWVTDGTQAGTHLLVDLCTGACSGEPSTYLETDIGLLFRARYPQAFEYEGLWLARGGDSGAELLTDDLLGGPSGGYYGPSGSAILAGQLIFPAGDPRNGTGVWSLNLETGLSSFLGPGSGAEGTGSLPFGMAIRSDELFARFSTSIPYTWGDSIFATGGPEGALVEILGDHSGCPLLSYGLYEAGERIVFTNTCGNGEQIFVVDSGSNQSRLLRELPGWVDQAVVAGDRVAFVIANWELFPPYRLWSTTGTEAGTLAAAPFPGDSYSRPELQVASEKLLFFTYAGSGAGLWTTDATFSGFALVETFSAASSILSPLIPAGDVGFFSESPAYGTTNLWVTDGTAIGTRLLGDLGLAVVTSAASTSNGYHLLASSPGAPSIQVVTVDAGATAAQVGAQIPALNGSNAWGMTGLGESSFFAAGGPYTGTDLWRSDGTQAGTVSIGRLQPVGDYAAVVELNRVGNALYFPGYDETHGRELWRLVGELGVPELVQDINPGPESSAPTTFAHTSTKLYFTADDGIHGRELWVLPLDGGPACRASETAMCLEDGRFRVEADWWDFSGNSGRAQAVPLTSDTGTFWFFDEANVEMILKVIDGTSYNGHHWVYYGALSNVEYSVTITNTTTGAAKRYFNPAGRFASSGDITAFGPLGAHAAGESIEEPTRAGTPPEVVLAALEAPLDLPGACMPSDTHFCLLNDRFAVSATWRDFHGNTGQGQAMPLTSDTGYFWFFGPENVEVVLKMVDGSGYNGQFWVYYGALSNVDYTLTVTDTVAGISKQYHNPLGAFGSFGDIEAFPAP